MCLKEEQFYDAYIEIQRRYLYMLPADAKK